MMGSIVSMIIFGDLKILEPTILWLVKPWQLKKHMFFAYFCMAFRVFHGTSPIETREFPAGFLRRQGEFLPAFAERERRDDATADEGTTREKPWKNHGKTMGKPWENQHGTRNAHKKDIKSNPEGLQGLQLRTLTFSI